jgi:hypothetical protein
MILFQLQRLLMVECESTGIYITVTCNEAGCHDLFLNNLSETWRRIKTNYGITGSRPTFEPMISRIRERRGAAYGGKTEGCGSVAREVCCY